MIHQQATLTDPLTGILELLDKVKQTAPNQWKALCPAHDDHTPSLSVTQVQDSVLIKCHAGCSTEKIVSALGLSMADLYPNESNLKNAGICEDSQQHWTPRENLSDSGQIVAKYDYTDASGSLLYQVVRYDPKDFRQRHPAESGGWIWNMKSIPRVLYHLPDILAADPDTWLFIVEGEKDADALASIGLVATTNPGGAGKWSHLSDDSALHKRRIAIIPDHDNPGEVHALDVAKHLRATVKEIRIVDLGKDAKFAGKDVSDWLDWLDSNEADVLAHALLEKVKSSPQWVGEEWRKPQALREDMGTIPIFPIGVFPIWLRNIVSEVAVSTQTPIDLAGSIALGVLAITGGGKIQVQVSPDWRESLNLYIAVAMPSGARKSSVFSKMITPIEKWEETEQNLQGEEIARANTERDIMKKRLSSLKKKGADGGITEEKEALDLSVELSKKTIPALPRLLGSDVTPEAAVRLLAQHNGRMGLFSAEGAELISIMSGRYSKNGQSNIDVFLKAHSGDTITVDRADRSREPIIIRRPALTLVLCLQPCVLESAWQSKEFRDRGLLARFLFVLPQDLMGIRDVDVPFVSDSAANSYNEHIQHLLDLPLRGPGEEQKTLFLSENALELLNNFRRQLEPKLGPDGQYEQIIGWAAKHPGTVVRIAGLLHLAHNTTCPEPWLEPINAQTMNAAITLGEFFSRHTERVQGVYGGTPETRMAVNILSRIKRAQMKGFTERDMYRGLGVKRDEIIEPLKFLEETDHIRLVVRHQENSGKRPGRKPSLEWEVNPSLLTGSVNYVNSVKGGLDE